MRCEPADEFAARLSIVDPKEHVRTEIRRRPRPQHGRLDLVQLECRRARRTILTGGFHCGRHGRILFLGPGRIRPGPDRTSGRWGYPTLSSSSSTALPTFSSFRVSAAVRFGLLTYQASAAIWCLAIQSAAAFGLRIPG